MNGRRILVAGKRVPRRHIQLFVLGKAVQHDGELLAREGGTGTEHRVAVTGDDAVRHTPLHRSQEGRILRDVLKGERRIGLRRVLHAVQRLHQSGTGRRSIGGKGVFRNAVHQIGLHGKFHGLLCPVRFQIGIISGSDAGQQRQAEQHGSRSIAMFFQKSKPP